jgi:hypothetical protein
VCSYAPVEEKVSLSRKLRPLLLSRLLLGEQWAIIVQVDYQNLQEATIELTPEFFKGLRDSLCCLDAAQWNALTKPQMTFLEQEAAKVAVKVGLGGKNKGGASVSFPAMTCEDLERYTQTQWDVVLHYLVGTPNLRVQPNAAVTHFLLQTNLMLQPDLEQDRGVDIDEAPLVITQKGLTISCCRTMRNKSGILSSNICNRWKPMKRRRP